MTVFTATITKESPESKVGIGLKTVNSSNVFISTIRDDSPFVNTSLEVGHRVLSVNDQDVKGMNNKEVIGLIQAAPSTLTIVATDEVVQRPAAASKTTSAAVPEQSKKKEFHPRGTLPGGQWYVHVSRQFYRSSLSILIVHPFPATIRGRNSHVGGATIACAICSLLFFLPGLLVLCCPCDERKVYLVDGKIYDEEGRYLGPSGTLNFQPTRAPPKRK